MAALQLNAAEAAILLSQDFAGLAVNNLVKGISHCNLLHYLLATHCGAPLGVGMLIHLGNFVGKQLR